MRVVCLVLPIILVSAAALVSTLQVVQQVTADFFQNLTLTCDLTEYSDLLVQGPVNVSWESMGKDVVRYDGSLHYGPLFAQRASAVWEDGKLIVELNPVVFSDSDIFECLWHGWKTLSMVFVDVVEGPDPDEIEIVQRFVADGVKLPCSGRISKSRTLGKVSVYWKKDGTIIYSLTGGKNVFSEIDGYVNLDRIHEYGDMSLYINKLTLEHSGTYECVYRDNSFGEMVHGTPKMLKLMVVGDVDPTEIEPFDISTVGPTNSIMAGISAPTDQEEVNSQAAEVSPEMQPTSVPETSPGTEETLPWVRIGIICGVLIITALVLGPLVAMGKI